MHIRGMVAGFLAVLGSHTPAPAMVQLPVEVTTWNASPAIATVSANLPASGNAAAWLYMRIHNLRFGGQVSVRLDSGDWVHLYNHTTAVSALELSQGGIGGINRTVVLSIPLSPGQAPAGQAHTVTFRLNGTDGVTSAIRVVDLDFLDASGARLLAPGELTQEDPGTWTPPSTNPADIAAGSNLWATAAIVNDSIQQTPINAKCASCHFRDGSDLKYFNYSNDTIISRARFHGLTQLQGEQIASYIRSLAKPNPGRPWNPPFQPGPNLDPDPGDSPATKQVKAESWFAGGGLAAVTASDAEALTSVFPEGTSRASIAKVIEHEGNFSVREVPIPFQFPDWNAWLPHFAPEDLWPTSFYYDQPYAFYQTMRNTLATQGPAALANAGQLSETMAKFNRDLNNWYGDFRLEDHDLANESAVSLARSPGLSREDVVRALVHWMGVKILESVREHNLEDKADAVAAMQAAGDPRYEPELLGIPSGFRLSVAFAFAPHIISDNWDNFTNQPEAIGKMESDQWYHLQLLLNSGARKQDNMNVPLDWDYQLLHLEQASDRTGIPYGIQHLITHIKMYQSRDNGAGVKISGFSQRTLSPWRLYSDQYRFRSMHKDVFEDIEPGLWRKLYEEFVYEWLDVMESMDLNDPVLVPRSLSRHELEPDTYVPTPWPGANNQYFKHPDEVYADLMYRLLPLLPKDGVDEMLLEDLIRWSKRAWPLGDWDNLITSKSIYFENFEDGASDFDVTNAALTVTAIKDTSTYVNNYAIGVKNGGGAYVGQRGLTANVTRQGIHDTINVPLNGATRLKLMARVAFKDTDGVDPGGVTFKMQMRFNGAGTTYEAEDVLTLDPGLFGGEFETYESHLNVPGGATNITWLAVGWERIGGAGAGTVYLDNLHMVPVDTAADMTPPGKPGINNVTVPSAARLRVIWPANPVGDGVAGYNVYRWRSSDSVSSKVKINVGLVDNPYIWFEDYTVPRGVSHSYHVTAVDASGNESVPSNTRSNTLPDTEGPLIPSPLWAIGTSGALHLGWFGGQSWDLAGYDVYRKAPGEPVFSMLTTVADPAEAIFFTDPTAIQNQTYDYYVLAFDLLGNLSPQSPTLSIQAQTGVTFVSLWKNQFQGTNGWDAENPLIAGDAFDFDRDGIASLWEYLLGRNPAVADSTPASFPNATLAPEGGETYLEITYERQATLPPGVLVKVGFSNDLLKWPVQEVVEGGPAGAGISVTFGGPAGGRQSVTVRQTAPIGDGGAFRFMRLIAEQPAP